TTQPFTPSSTASGQFPQQFEMISGRPAQTASMTESGFGSRSEGSKKKSDDAYNSSIRSSDCQPSSVTPEMDEEANHDSSSRRSGPSPAIRIFTFGRREPSTARRKLRRPFVCS